MTDTWRIAALTRPFPGESHNGDAFYAAKLGPDASLKEEIASNPTQPGPRIASEMTDFGEGDSPFLAVVDGVGHGVEAAATTAKVLDCLRTHHKLDLVSLVKECHRTALHSRGATIGIARLHPSSSRIEFIGVGDVSMRILALSNRQAENEPPSLFGPPGSLASSVQILANNTRTIGYRIPDRLRTNTCKYSPGDILLLASDGIRQHIDLADVEDIDVLDLAAVARRLISNFASDRDDATVVVASYTAHRPKTLPLERSAL